MAKRIYYDGETCFVQMAKRVLYRWRNVLYQDGETYISVFVICIYRLHILYYAQIINLFFLFSDGQRLKFFICIFLQEVGENKVCAIYIIIVF